MTHQRHVTALAQSGQHNRLVGPSRQAARHQDEERQDGARGVGFERHSQHHVNLRLGVTSSTRCGQGRAPHKPVNANETYAELSFDIFQIRNRGKA